ncbi:MAG: hypothetical protein H6712_25825 [Myxococcales bacterium]|nr:hypothetical protein [Myxococcales bacterium]MCB9717295.1 hypothetical protein [Myxococcales bacterium]
MKNTAEVVKVKDAIAWIDVQRDGDEGSVALRAATRDGQPIQLTAAETRLLAERLAKLADTLDSLTEQRRESED